METWMWVVVCLCYGCFNFVLGAWWRSVFADVPMVEVYPPIPVEDTYGRASKALMDGKI